MGYGNPQYGNQGYQAQGNNQPHGALPPMMRSAYAASGSSSKKGSSDKVKEMKAEAALLTAQSSVRNGLARTILFSTVSYLSIVGALYYLFEDKETVKWIAIVLLGVVLFIANDYRVQASNINMFDRILEGFARANMNDAQTDKLRTSGMLELLKSHRNETAATIGAIVREARASRYTVADEGADAGTEDQPQWLLEGGEHTPVTVTEGQYTLT